MGNGVRVQVVYDEKLELQDVLREVLDERVTLVVGKERADARTRCKIADMIENGADVSLRFFVSRNREGSIHCITAMVKEHKSLMTEEEKDKIAEELLKESEVANEKVAQ